MRRQMATSTRMGSAVIDENNELKATNVRLRRSLNRMKKNLGVARAAMDLDHD